MHWLWEELYIKKGVKKDEQGKVYPNGNFIIVTCFVLLGYEKTWVKVMLIYLELIDTDSDKEKLEIIYTEYKDLMFYVANKILGDTRDSEDIVHDAFVKIAEIIEKIDTAKCPKTRNLVVTIVERKAIDLYRQRKRRKTVFLDEELINVLSVGDIQADPARPLIAEAIALLPTRYRALVLLKYDSGYSEKEIAALLSMTEANVHKTMQRAKEKLGQILEKLEEDKE